MKILLSLIAFTFSVVMLFGCSTTYTIRTKDGIEFQSLERPEVTEDGFLKFETKSGRKVLLKRDEVSAIGED